ncbi:MAG: hypothetical protein EXX96DRAFT_548184 [Benjaminiella poitrasii]|nr:MAG: hypothetical protein EXX96DRAFT_548184 [Benjaminiella poitrasii]
MSQQQDEFCSMILDPINENYAAINQHLGQLTPSQQHQDQQFPTYKEFDAIVQDYLQNLSSKKRDKALIDQARYAMILQVLKDPRNTAVSTAQFRFWVKKMFQLNSRQVVCHDGKPVAMREQIYSILVRAHREAHHGGRDKTSALVRRRYSWIPKELIARFVRHCPFCISRRNGTQQQQPLFTEERTSDEIMMMAAAAAAAAAVTQQQDPQYAFDCWQPATTFDNTITTTQQFKQQSAVYQSNNIQPMVDEYEYHPLMATLDLLYEAPIVNSHTSPSLSPSSSVTTSATSSPVHYNVPENNYFLRPQQPTLLSHQQLY